MVASHRLEHQLIHARFLLQQELFGIAAGWRLRAKLRAADRDPRVAFACVQSLEKARPEVRADIVRWLDARIGSLPAALGAAVSSAR